MKDKRVIMSGIIFNSLIRFCRAWAVAHQPRVWSNVVVKSTSGRNVGVVLDGTPQSVYWDSSIIPRQGSSCFVVQDSHGHLVGFNGSQDLQLSVDIVRAGRVPQLQKNNASKGGGAQVLNSLTSHSRRVVVIIRGFPRFFKDPRMSANAFEAVLVDLAGNKYAVPVYLPAGYSFVDDQAFATMIANISLAAGVPCPSLPI